MRTVYGIDPGSKESAFVGWNGERHKPAYIVSNDHLLGLIHDSQFSASDIIGIEQVRSYGMPIGNETLDTCEWSGRFREAAEKSGAIVSMVPRKLVVIHLCGSVGAGGDTAVNQALRAKYGDALKGITSHLYAALGVADYVLSKGV